MLYLITVLTAVVSYLLGSINSSIIISKAISGKDIRESGSGNAGATNMLREHGKKMGAVTLLCDVAKGIIAVAIAALVVKYIRDNVVYTAKEAQLMGAVYDREVVEGITFGLTYIAGMFAVIGHDFPIFFGFRGGKGVATSLGVLFMWDWRTAVVILVIAVAIMAFTKYVSLGSVTAAVLYAIAVIVSGIISKNTCTAAVICPLIISILLIVKHRQNIKRLLNGTENKLKMTKERNG